MKVFILAGGFATRLWPLTENRAKPLLPVAGKPLLSHLVDQIPKDLPITVSTNAALAEGFHEWQTQYPDRKIKIVVEHTKHDDEKLGALGATAQWISEQFIKEDILLLTGDNYLGFSLKEFLECYDGKTPLLAAHDIKDLEKASAFGTVILKDETNGSRTAHVAAFDEKPKKPKSTLVSAGCYVLPTHTLPTVTAFAKKKPDNVGGIFEEFLRLKQDVMCFSFEEPWLDIGSFSSYLDAHRLLVDGKNLLAPTAKVTATVFHGSNSIGAESTVHGSDLADCLVFDHCSITDCTLKNCVIDEGCVLRGIDLNGKMLRAGTRLELD
jgi:glucose-1-phosphate thymidylyltransferase